VLAARPPGLPFPRRPSRAPRLLLHTPTDPSRSSPVPPPTFASVPPSPQSVPFPPGLLRPPAFPSSRSTSLTSVLPRFSLLPTLLSFSPPPPQFPPSAFSLSLLASSRSPSPSPPRPPTSPVLAIVPPPPPSSPPPLPPRVDSASSPLSTPRPSAAPAAHPRLRAPPRASARRFLPAARRRPSVRRAART